jgi:hypothetical protein
MNHTPQSQSPLSVGIDAAWKGGPAHGSDFFTVSLIKALAKLRDGGEQYLLLCGAEDDGWLEPYLGGLCRLLHLLHCPPVPQAPPAAPGLETGGEADFPPATSDPYEAVEFSPQPVSA